MDRALAVVAFSRDFPRLGDRRNSSAARFLRKRGGAGICRPVYRDDSQTAAALLLSSSSAPQICSLESSAHRVRHLFLETPGSHHATGNALAGLLEHRCAGRHVGHSFEAGRSDFSGGAAALLVVRRAGRALGEIERWRTKMRPWLAGALLFAVRLHGRLRGLEDRPGTCRRGAMRWCNFRARFATRPTKHHWRYEVVGGREEGMLLYLRRPHFLNA